MTGIRLISLYSGSEGNAFLVKAPTGTILIDAGKSAKRLCMALSAAGVSPDEIGAVLITHEHTDHISALPVFLKKHPVPVHLPAPCAEKLEREAALIPCLRPHPPIYTAEICGMQVTAFPTPHDSRGASGYHIEIPAGDGTTLSFGYATDIGYVSANVESGLLGCSAVVLESNHDPEMLENGPYPYDLKLRIASRRGHLSNPDSATFATRLCAMGTKKLMLAHLSRENNRADLAYDECFSAVGDDRVDIYIARPDEITEMNLEDA